MQAHFGFEPIDARARQSRVNAVFERVATSYDRMNDAMSLGLHRWWKQELVQHLALRPGESLLDLAGGTGDIIRRVRQKGALAFPSLLTDINPAMLQEARRRFLDEGHTAETIPMVAANAEILPFREGTFDAVTISFGLRNVTDIARALRSVHQVLKPGGRFFCLEFSQPSLPWLAKMYDAYSFQVIPRLGQWIAHDKAAYQYLVESIRRFPAPDVLRAMLEEAGFYALPPRLFHNGIVALHGAYKP
jgi:demethylmenaquinone methyltransferase / 2-methoxy-6-polyprenyl-1,4-benzoquinol methylase